MTFLSLTRGRSIPPGFTVFVSSARSRGIRLATGLRTRPGASPANAANPQDLGGHGRPNTRCRGAPRGPVSREISFSGAAVIARRARGASLQAGGLVASRRIRRSGSRGGRPGSSGLLRRAPSTRCRPPLHRSSSHGRRREHRCGDQVTWSHRRWGAVVYAHSGLEVHSLTAPASSRAPKERAPSNSCPWGAAACRPPDRGASRAFLGRWGEHGGRPHIGIPLGRTSHEAALRLRD